MNKPPLSQLAKFTQAIGDSYGRHDPAGFIIWATMSTTLLFGVCITECRRQDMQAELTQTRARLQALEKSRGDHDVPYYPEEPKP